MGVMGGLGLGALWLLVEVWGLGGLGPGNGCPRSSWGHLRTGSLGLDLWLGSWPLGVGEFLGSGFWELRGIDVRPGWSLGARACL